MLPSQTRNPADMETELRAHTQKDSSGYFSQAPQPLSHSVVRAMRQARNTYDV